MYGSLLVPLGKLRLFATVIPLGKAIFFPIINSEASIREGYGTNEKELRANAKSDIDKVILKEVTVDGKNLKDLDNYRVSSKAFVFTVPAKNNILGLTEPPYSSLAVSDGYWIMLTPLSKGKHVIYIHGKAKMSDTFTFETEVTYNLNVIPKCQ